MIIDHWSFEEGHPLRHPPCRQRACDKAEQASPHAEHLAADGTNDRSDDKTDQRLEELHPASRIRSTICRTMLSTITATIALRSNPPTGGMMRRSGSTIQSVRT